MKHISIVSLNSCLNYLVSLSFIIGAVESKINTPRMKKLFLKLWFDTHPTTALSSKNFSKNVEVPLI